MQLQIYHTLKESHPISAKNFFSAAGLYIDFKLCMGKNVVFQYSVSTEGKIKKSIKNSGSFVQ